MTKTLAFLIKGALLAAAIAFVAACTSEEEPGKAAKSGTGGQAPAAASTAAASGASVSVKADKTHAVQPEDQITLTVSVSDFRLSPEAIGGANEEGVGHYRVYLDDASGDDYLVSGADATTKVTIPADISDGSHDLRVVLRNNDKSPLEPPVEGSVLLIVYRL